jgi:hypothetical protein
MAIAELPPAFQAIPLTEAERASIVRFIAEAPKVAPAVHVLSPRRSSSGHIKIVLEFPEGVNTCEMTADLIGLVHRIEDETGVYLHLD